MIKFAYLVVFISALANNGVDVKIKADDDIGSSRHEMPFLKSYSQDIEKPSYYERYGLAPGEKAIVVKKKKPIDIPVALQWFVLAVLVLLLYAWEIYSPSRILSEDELRSQTNNFPSPTPVTPCEDKTIRWTPESQHSGGPTGSE